MPDMGLLALFGVGSVIMRGAGCKLLPLPLYTAGRNKQTPLATKNLLEDTDGLRRPPFYDAIHQCPLDRVALCFY